MICKPQEVRKITINLNNICLIYGKNNGLKKSITDILTETENKIDTYDEKEVLDKKNDFLENIFNKSLFDDKKTIVIKRATVKLLEIIEQLDNKQINDVIIIQSESLEKKSKLRTFFEKHKTFICIPVYPDDNQTLFKITLNYFRNKKIQISPSGINQIVNKSNFDRENLYNEIEKIENYSKNKKNISEEDICKLVNLNENYNVSELIDNCLARNKNKMINIINDNNYTNDDCILIIRTFLNKAKKILNLSLQYEQNGNIDLTISKSKPPIFWKDKEIVKQQIYNWKPSNLKKLIYEINEIELKIKNNLNIGLYTLTNFLLEKTLKNTNN